MTSPKLTPSTPEQLDFAFMPAVCTDPTLDVIKSNSSSNSENGVNHSEQGLVSSSNPATFAVVFTECANPALDVIEPEPSLTSEKGAIPKKRGLISPPKQTDSASTPTICNDLSLYVIESATLLESENGASLELSAIFLTSLASDSSLPAPDLDALLPSGSETDNDMSSEENVSQPEDLQSATSSTKAAQREKEISAFAKAEGICDPVQGKRTGILTSLVGLCLSAMSIPLWATGEGQRSLIVFVTSLVIGIIGLLVVILGMKGEERIQKFLEQGDSNKEEAANKLLTFRNTFHRFSGGQQQNGIGNEIIALRRLPREPEGHHERIERFADERRSRRKRSRCPTCCQKVPSDFEIDSDNMMQGASQRQSTTKRSLTIILQQKPGAYLVRQEDKHSRERHVCDV